MILFQKMVIGLAFLVYMLGTYFEASKAFKNRTFGPWNLFWVIHAILTAIIGWQLITQ